MDYNIIEIVAKEKDGDIAEPLARKLLSERLSNLIFRSDIGEVALADYIDELKLVLTTAEALTIKNNHYDKRNIKSSNLSKDNHNEKF